MELINKHSEICKQVAAQMVLALGDYFQGKDLTKYEEVVDRLEDESDDIKKKFKEIYMKLKWSFFDRFEMRKLISDQERMVDVVDDILKLLMMNAVEDVPDGVKDKMVKLAEEAEKAVSEMAQVVEDLSKVVESGFSPVEIKKEDEKTREVEKEETRTDQLGRELGREIFALKSSMNAVDVMFLGRIVMMIMEVAELAENAAERIRMLLM